MSKYINKFEEVKNYISKEYISNEDFIECNKEQLIIDVRFNTNAKINTVKEVLEIYIKKNILKERDGFIVIANI